MKFRAMFRAVAVGSTVAIALAACGGGSEAGTATNPANTATDAAPTEPAAANAVFVPLADGTQFDFNSLQGQDVLLWFWAPW